MKNHMYTIICTNYKLKDKRNMYAGWRFACEEIGDKKTLLYTPIFTTISAAREFIKNPLKLCDHGDAKLKIIKVKIYEA